MRGIAIGKVVATKTSGLSIGTYVQGTTGWTEFAVMAEKDVEKVEVPANGKVTDVLGVLGASLLVDPALLLPFSKLSGSKEIIHMPSCGRTAPQNEQQFKVSTLSCVERL